jgi:hypothetical protein
MTMFDQQPMGPVPARRPILMPPDPELEAAVSDPATAEVRLVGVIPKELVGARPVVDRAPQPLRLAVAWLLLAPLLISMVAAISMVSPRGEENLPVPTMLAIGILVVTMIGAHLFWRHLARTWRRGS